MVMDIGDIVPGLGEAREGPKTGQHCGAIFSIALGVVHLGLAAFDTVALANSDESRVYVRTETGHEFWTPIVWITFCGYVQALLAAFSIAHRVYRRRESGIMRRNAFVSLVRFIMYLTDIGFSIWFICQYYRTYTSDRIRDSVHEFYPLLYVSAEIHKWIFWIVVAVLCLFVLIGVVACVSAKTCARGGASKADAAAGPARAAGGLSATAGARGPGPEAGTGAALGSKSDSTDADSELHAVSHGSMDGL